MSKLASFERFNYAVRPNKNVERKVFAEVLSVLAGPFGLSSYRYIGLGSMWFVDFVLFHKTLRIRDMISIEREAADRARFNAPLNCVRVEAGDTSTVLPELNLAATPLLAWLDYDGSADPSVLEDVKLLASVALRRSILLFSVNASHTQFDSKEVKDAASENLKATLREALIKTHFGDAAPEPFPKASISKGAFSGVLADMLFSWIDRAILKAGRKDKAEFVRLFNVVYSDGAPMVTVGGMIATAEDKAMLASCNLPARFPFVGSAQQTRIDVPPLTIKEKMAIDSLLPRADTLSSDLVAGRCGFLLDQESLDAYATYYWHYPVFSELIPS